MPSITLENLPDPLNRHRKPQRRLTPEERLARVRAIRPKLDQESVDLEELLGAIDEGRP